MQLRYITIIFCAFFFAGCQSSHDNENDAGKDRWYKHYTGTIAGVPVVANLFFDGDRSARGGIKVVSGNYYYRHKSDLIDLTLEKITGSEISMTEYPPDERDDEKARHALWLVQINDSIITGTWKNADGSKSYPVLLKENYEQGSYAFDVLSLEDSVSFKSPKNAYIMTSGFNLLNPSGKVNKEDAQFIVKALLHQLGGDTLGAKDLMSYIKATNKADFKEYTAAETEIFKDTGAWDGESNNWEETMDGTLEYNDRGIVVFGFARYDYSGGAHPNSWNRYVCMDIAGKKVLHLGDILNIDTPKLRSMLEVLIRRHFDMKPGYSLSSRLLVDTIPVTDNIIISETGITFHYNAYEIASYVDGDSYYRISYAQLGDMLKPEFKARMLR